MSGKGSVPYRDGAMTESGTRHLHVRLTPHVFEQWAAWCARKGVRKGVVLRWLVEEMVNGNPELDLVVDRRLEQEFMENDLSEFDIESIRSAAGLK